MSSSFEWKTTKSVAVKTCNSMWIEPLKVKFIMSGCMKMWYICGKKLSGSLISFHGKGRPSVERASVEVLGIGVVKGRLSWSKFWEQLQPGRASAAMRASAKMAHTSRMTMSIAFLLLHTIWYGYLVYWPSFNIRPLLPASAVFETNKIINFVTSSNCNKIPQITEQYRRLDKNFKYLKICSYLELVLPLSPKTIYSWSVALKFMLRKLLIICNNLIWRIRRLIVTSLILDLRRIQANKITAHKKSTAAHISMWSGEQATAVPAL